MSASRITHERRGHYIQALTSGLKGKVCIVFTVREAEELAELLQQHLQYERWCYSTQTSKCPAALPAGEGAVFPRDVKRVRV